MLLGLESCQVIIVMTPSWEAHQGELYRFERADPVSHEWKLQGKPIAAVVGKNGMAWGIGLHPSNDEVCKKEGDGKAPAGIFSLGPAFGFAPSLAYLKIDYLHLDPMIEAVDDPRSRYYNQIVRRDQILDRDWTSSEKMAQEPLYEMGLVVQYNWHQPVPGAGSAIFMHLWRDENRGTEGCTAMNRSDMQDLLAWLDPQKKPLLIQLPSLVYYRMMQEWGLIDISCLKNLK